MTKENIGIGVHYIALHLHPYYKKLFGYKRGFPQRGMDFRKDGFSAFVGETQRHRCRGCYPGGKKEDPGQTPEMNLCLITSSYPLNPRDAQAAAGFFVRDFAIELYQAGHNIYILTQQKEGPVEDAEGLKVIRYKWAKEARPLSRLNPFNPRDILSRILPLIKNGERALLDLIRREKIDFCLAMWAIPAGYLTYLGHKKLKIPYAVYCLGSDIWDYGKNPLFLPLLKNILDNTQSLFADGRQLALDVGKNI